MLLIELFFLALLDDFKQLVTKIGLELEEILREAFGGKVKMPVVRTLYGEVLVIGIAVIRNGGQIRVAE